MHTFIVLLLINHQIHQLSVALGETAPPLSTLWPGAVLQAEVEHLLTL